MELEEFVKESIVQILSGVKKAQECTGELGHSIVNPHDIRYRVGEYPIHLVEFDVAIVAVNSDKKGGKAGIGVVGINAGGGIETTESTSTVSRLKFQIPVSYPTNK